MYNVMVKGLVMGQFTKINQAIRFMEFLRMHTQEGVYIREV